MKTVKFPCFPVIVMAITFLGGVCVLHAGESMGPEPAIDVHTASIKRMTLHRELTFYGRVVSQPATGAHRAASSRVAAIMAGQIVAVPAIEGAVVHRGDVLVRLDSRQADAAVRRAFAMVRKAKAAYLRQQTLARTDDTSSRKYDLAEQQLAEARATLKEAETRRDLHDVKAPLDGTVLQVNVRPGEAVTTGTVVVEIQDLGRLTAEVQIPASQLSEVRAGQLSAVQSSGIVARGKVTFIGMRINPATGTAPARIDLPDGSGLHPGQFVRARVSVEEHNGMVVPVNAVFHQPDGSGLVAVITGDRVARQLVRLGIEEGGYVEISGAGISEDLQVVTDEVYGLPVNARVHIIER